MSYAALEGRADGGGMNATDAPQTISTRQCWCGEAALYVNPASCAGRQCAVCLEHVADGYAPLPTEPEALAEIMPGGECELWPTGWYVMDSYARTVVDAHVAGPYASALTAEGRARDCNISGDVEVCFHQTGGYPQFIMSVPW